MSKRQGLLWLLRGGQWGVTALLVLLMFMLGVASVKAGELGVSDRAGHVKDETKETTMSQPSEKEKVADYATKAELFLAGYADFDKDASHSEELRRVGMTDLQIEDFLKTWKFIIQAKDPSTGFSATIFEHRGDGKSCLAVNFVQPMDPSKSDQHDAKIKAQIVQWINDGLLPKGAIVVGGYASDYTVLGLKKKFPDHIYAIYLFLVDTSIKAYGPADSNGVFATDLFRNVMTKIFERRSDGARCLPIDLKSEIATLRSGSGQNHWNADGNGPPPSNGNNSLGKAGEMPTTNEQNLEDNNMKRLASTLLLLQLFTGCATSIQMEMDAEVDRLCAIDGGTKIYETVSLPPEKFAKNGDINFYQREGGRENWLGPEYIWKSSTEYIQGGERTSPSLRRGHNQIFRRSDGKLLGESIWYSRVGGDPYWMEHGRGYPPTHYSCPKGSISVVGGVFIKDETGRTK